MITNWLLTRCVHRTGPPIAQLEALQHLEQLNNWQLKDSSIEKDYLFKDFYKTMAFVNAVAWIAHAEDHHPELCLSYNRCKLRFNTHSVGGLSLNDFICAAKVDALLSSNSALE